VSDDIDGQWVWFKRGAIAVVLAGLLAGFAWFNWALDDQTRTVNAMQRLPPRTGIPIEVAEAGTYTIWAGAGCGGFCDVPPLSELYEYMALGFENEAGMIRPEPFPGQQRYRLNGEQHGTAAWLVEFEEPGTYVVERLNSGTGSVTLLLGEGEGMETRITSGLVTIGLVTVAAAALLLGVGLYRRRRALDAMMERIHGGY
jgi:hypothetical protein